MSARVLVVEDDESLRSTLVTSLTARGYVVRDASSGDAALYSLSTGTFDVVVLDLGLPGTDGFGVLQRLRAFSRVPVIVLTVRGEPETKVLALDAGADDYVTKPFDTDELHARVRAAIRRGTNAPEGEAVTRVDDLTIDLARGEVTRSGEAVHLTPTELTLLELLVSSRGRLVTHTTVGRRLGKRGRPLDPKAQRVFVAQLRKKLGDDASDPRLIHTHFGVGYRWIPGNSDREVELLEDS